MPKYTQPRKTWEYTNDFKIKAVKLSHQEEIQVKKVVAGLDIHPFRVKGEAQTTVFLPCRKTDGGIIFYP